MLLLPGAACFGLLRQQLLSTKSLDDGNWLLDNNDVDWFLVLSLLSLLSQSVSKGFDSMYTGHIV